MEEEREKEHKDEQEADKDEDTDDDLLTMETIALMASAVASSPLGLARVG